MKASAKHQISRINTALTRNWRAMRTDHGFQFDGAHDEVVEGERALAIAVAQHQRVQHAVVKTVAGRVQRRA